MQKIIYLVLIVVLAFWFAKVEIQIEGVDGWAKNLPTWRIKKHWLLDLFFGGREMTGYHAWVLSFILIFFHLPMAFVNPWTWSLEGRVLGGMLLFWIVEDFLWFMINPGYGLKKFKKEFIPWHPKWISIAPIEYWIFIPISGFLILY